MEKQENACLKEKKLELPGLWTPPHMGFPALKALRHTT